MHAPSFERTGVGANGSVLRARAVLSWIDRDSLLVPLAALYVGGLLAGLPAEINQDGWLSLVAGRVIAHDGLPSTDVLTTYTLGTDWVDQQWLAHLAFYGAASVGGVKAALLLHGLVASAALLLALVAARWRGGTTRTVVWIALPAMASLFVTSWQMRAQSFAYLLFVVVAWLLIADARAPSRRTLWVVPLLVVWANVHGSVLLGAALVALRGLLACLERPGFNRRRGAALTVAAVACLGVSPYGSSLVGYYGRTLFNRLFAQIIPEWAPPAPGPLTVPFYVLAAVALWIVARHVRRLTLFERLAMLGTGVSALFALRNVVWFAFLALMILPAAVSAATAPDGIAPPLAGRLLGRVAAAGLVVMVIVSITRPESWFESESPRKAGAAVADAAAQDGSARVYADVAYGDWLLWKYPALTGRVAYDARLELLSKRQFADIYRFSNQIGDRWRTAADGYGVLMLDRRTESSLEGSRAAYQQVSAGGAARVVYLDADTAVLVRP